MVPAPPTPDQALTNVIWPVNLHCSGSEETLQQCILTVLSEDLSNTAHFNTAGFQCRGK